MYFWIYDGDKVNIRCPMLLSDFLGQSSFSWGSSSISSILLLQWKFFTFEMEVAKTNVNKMLSFQIESKDRFFVR